MNVIEIGRRVIAVEKTDERHAPVSITPAKDGFERRVIWLEEDTGRKYVRAAKRWHEVRWSEERVRYESVRAF